MLPGNIPEQNADDFIDNFLIPYLKINFQWTYGRYGYKDFDEFKPIDTPVKFLADTKQWAILKKLAAKLKSVNKFDAYNDLYSYGYALTTAIKEKQYDLAFDLIKANANPNKPVMDISALYYAIDDNQEELVLALLASGANIANMNNIKYDCAESPVELSIKKGFDKITAYLLIHNKHNPKYTREYSFDYQLLRAQNNFPVNFKKGMALFNHFVNVANIIFLIALGKRSDNNLLCGIPVDLWPQIFNNILLSVLQDSSIKMDNENFIKIKNKQSEYASSHDKNNINLFLDNQKKSGYSFFSWNKKNDIDELVKNIESNKDNVFNVNQCIQDYFIWGNDDNFGKKDIIDSLKSHQLINNHDLAFFQSQKKIVKSKWGNALNDILSEYKEFTDINDSGFAKIEPDEDCRKLILRIINEYYHSEKNLSTIQNMVGSFITSRFNNKNYQHPHFINCLMAAGILSAERNMDVQLDQEYSASGKNRL